MRMARAQTGGERVAASPARASRPDPPTVPSPASRLVTALSTPWAAPIAVAAAGVGGCVFVALTDPTTPGGLVPPCPTKAVFGITCPGCGTARMLFCLLHGDVASAAHYNALALLALPLLLWSYLAWVWSRVRRQPLPRWQDWRWSPALAAGVLALWFVARLLPMEPFSTLRV